MPLDTLVPALVVLAMALAAITVILAVKAVSLRHRLRMAANAMEEVEARQTATLSSMQTEHMKVLHDNRNILLEPFMASECDSFRVTLENDRLSRLTVTYHEPLDETVVVDPTSESPYGQEILFETVMNHIHQEDRAMVRNAVIESLAQQKELNVVFRSIELDGSQKYLNARGRTLSSTKNDTIELVGTLQDLTGFIESRQKAVANARLLDSLLDQIPWPMWAVDQNSLITMWNKPMADLTGIRPEKVIGGRLASTELGVFKDIITGREPPDREPVSFIARTNPAIATGEAGNRAFKVTQIPVYGRNDTDRHIFGIIQSHEHKGGANGHSTEMEALGRLTSGVAHDFANMVHVILGYTDILKQDLRDHPVQLDDLGQIQDAGMRAEEMVRQLLAFCSKDSLDPGDTDLNAIIENFMGLLKRIVGDNITLRFHSTPGLHSIFADTSQIEKVLLALVTRAREALPDGGLIAISAKNVTVEEGWYVNESNMLPGEYVKLSVSNNGVYPGLEGDADQEDGELSAFGALEEIMSAIGGFINVHASADIGTTVSLYFVAARKVEADTAGAQNSPERHGKRDNSTTYSSSRATVLVVEDDASVRKLTAKALKLAGHKVLEAADGVEALRVFNSDPSAIDLLITDVIMPGMNGREVCDRIRQIKPGIPVLFCSGYSSDLLENEYMLNIQGLVIQKPYRSADLLATAARLLAAGGAAQGNLPI